MISNRCHMLGALVVALTLLATPAAAQYMYLDANGNGVHDSGDRLGTVGVPTTVDVWVVTDHNRDGSLVTCPQDAGTQMSLISYVVHLQASFGAVSYGGFVNRIGTVPFGEFNPGDGVRYKNGFGLITPTPPGTYRLCTLTVTPVTGSPRLDIVDLVSGADPPQNGGPEMTSFGSACVGNDFDNTYKLAGPNGGSDWTDVDGLAPYPGEVGPPVLAAIGNKTVNEGTCLTFTATATAPNGSPVTFFLPAGAPAGASITTGGQFSWCPTEAQGPGVYAVTVTVVDNVTQQTDSETIQVTVNEVNVAPVLTAISNKTVTAGNLLSFTATATDADLPANTLTFSLDPGAPAGAGITPGGNFSWTPTFSQAPGNYLVTVRVTDNGVPALSDAKSFAVFVSQGETGPPVLAAIGNKTVNEGTCLTFTATATAPNGSPVTFYLPPGAPAGASITTGGQFNWCPTEAQGPGVFTVTVCALDNVTQLTDCVTFTVAVLEVNLAPVLNPIGNKIVPLGSLLTFTATATDADIPANTRTFSLDPGAPPGATIVSATGVFSWTPSSSGTFPVTIRVTDNGTPPLSDSETILITVCVCANTAPVLAAIGNKAVNEGSLLSFTATATDIDVPAQTLTFSLGAGAPAGAAITAGGAFTWTPAETQGPGTFPITVIVTDDGVGNLADSETIQVTVNEVNQAPVLNTIGDKTASVGVLLAFAVVASDADFPANVLTFTLDPGAPPGATVTAGGTFTWTPATVGTFLITVRVTDNGSPPLSDSETFTVTVGGTCRPPTANAGGPYTGVVGVAVSLNGGGSSDPDGDVLTYLWDFGDGTSGAGVAPMHAYGAVGSYSIALEVSDACNLSDGDITSATISNCLTAFFYAIGNKSAMFNLQAGKPTECLQIEPVLGAFMAEDVDLGSVVLRSANTGSIDEVHALASKSSVGADRNGNGIDEITACFAKSDLRLLFSDLNATQTVEVTLEGNLVGGGKFCTTQGLSVKAAGGGGNLVASISPNPLNPSAVLTFATHERGPVLVQLFDVRGRLLRTLRDEADAAAGYHDVRIDGTSADGTRLGSGVYYLRIRAGGVEERKAITILK